MAIWFMPTITDFVLPTHATISGTYHWSTDSSHYPDKKNIEFDYHIANTKRKAKGIGENTVLLINRLFGQSKHPLKNLRKAQGILRLSNKYSREAMEYACEQALEFNRLNYDNINRFAKNFSIELTNRPTPARQLKLVYLQGDGDERSSGIIK